MEIVMLWFLLGIVWSLVVGPGWVVGYYIGARLRKVPTKRWNGLLHYLLWTVLLLVLPAFIQSTS